MFNRREKPKPHHRVMGFFWPAMGWRRTAHYFRHRVGRLPGSPYEIAGGFACGAAISFSPFVGLHFILGGVWAWLIRCNILSSAIGTAVGNPWTFPFIWVWIYQAGQWMGAGSGATAQDVTELDFGALFGNMLEATLAGDMEFLVQTAAPVFWPMLVGSLPTMAVIWVGFYFPLKAMVAGYQKGRVARRARKAREAEASMAAEEKETMP